MYAKEVKAILSNALETISKLEASDVKANDIASKGDNTFIRVHWMYAENARRNPTLKRVCTWSNGDEGYVAVK